MCCRMVREQCVGSTTLQVGRDVNSVRATAHSNTAWTTYLAIAAACIVAEMQVYSRLHVVSSNAGYGPVIYWFVVTVISAFVAYGRFELKPFQRQIGRDKNVGSFRRGLAEVAAVYAWRT